MTDLNMIVELKIAGVAMQADTSKMDISYLRKCLEYGVRRWVNDSHSGLEPATKVDACKKFIQTMESGEEMPERVRTASVSRDPVMDLALKNAKADLTARFKAATQATKAIDFAQHEKIAPFFNVKEDRATWVDATVVKWMDKQKEDGKRDYKAEAEATLNPTSEVDDALSELDF